MQAVEIEPTLGHQNRILSHIIYDNQFSTESLFLKRGGCLTNGIFFLHSEARSNTAVPGLQCTEIEKRLSPTADHIDESVEVRPAEADGRYSIRYSLDTP